MPFWSDSVCCCRDILNDLKKYLNNFSYLHLKTLVLSNPSDANSPSALVGGTIYVSPIEAPIRDGVVLIRDGVITAVGNRTSVEVPPTA
ncbi:MAG: hypothetical protein O7C75_05165 [Verrucomicrobia bacterium]|nr:hypothetical protein [Verrucomicrobiota bacterium]